MCHCHFTLATGVCTLVFGVPTLDFGEFDAEKLPGFTVGEPLLGDIGDAIL